MTAPVQTDSVVCGICQADASEFFRSLPEDCADLVFGSPPYSGKGGRYGTGGHATSLRGREWASWMADVVQEAMRVTVGLVCFVVDAGVEKHSYDVAVHRLIVELDDRGVEQARVSLYRRNGTPGNRSDLRNDYELIVRAKRPGPIPFLDLYACAKPPVYGPGGACTNRDAKGRRARKREYRAPPLANPGNNFIETYTADEVLEWLPGAGDAEKYPNGGGHLGSKQAHNSAAPFSQRLANFYVRTFSRPGGLVLDPFSGSGTTAAAALEAGRLFLGCDNDPAMVLETRRRIIDTHQKMARATKESR